MYLEYGHELEKGVCIWRNKVQEYGQDYIVCTDYKMEKQKEAEDKDIDKVRNTSIGTVTQVSINIRKHQKEKKKMVTNTKHDT